MKPISTSWSCQRCGAAYISTPPEHGLCGQCLADLEALASATHPGTGTQTCPECGGPVCPDCGQAMTVLVPVPVSSVAHASVAGQAAQVVAAYWQHRQEVSGDDT